MKHSERRNALGLFWLALFLTIQLQSASDFSGKWILNRDRTDFGDVSESSTPVQLIVNQQKDSVKIERTMKNEQLTSNVLSETLPLNGKLSESITNNVKKISSVSWSSDGKSLIEEAKFSDVDRKVEYTGTEVWSLADAGKTLIVAKVNVLNGINYTRKMIYEKQ